MKQEGKITRNLKKYKYIEAREAGKRSYIETISDCYMVSAISIQP